MATKAFVIIAAGFLVAGAGLLVLGGVVGSSELAVVGSVCIAVVFGAREAWLWKGTGRQWLAGLLAIGVVIAAAAAVQVVL